VKFQNSWRKATRGGRRGSEGRKCHITEISPEREVWVTLVRRIFGKGGERQRGGGG
jgi:hypothetical protein